MSFDERTALADSRRLLTEWLGTTAPQFSRPTKDISADLVVAYGRHRMFVELKNATNSAAIGAAIEQIKQATRRRGNAVPVVAVPYMGDLGKRLCAEADVSWFDLSGNADIDAPGLRVLIEGKPNRFVRSGRPSTVFAPKSARIARRLLIEPRRAFRQQELAEATGLDDGFTSRIVRRLEEDRLVTRESGAIRVSAPDRLLDAWAERYDFQKHEVLRGHVSARTGEELLARVAGTLDQRKAEHAATGLAAAWVYTQFAGFRLVTFFVGERPSKALLETMKFREEPKGANVWLVVPNDAGVFDGATTKGAVRCVHPVQAFLDLHGHPERAKEAATELRSRMLRWEA
jgi:hypothetical protein